MRERRLNEIKGLILIAAALIVLASLISFTPFDLSLYTSHPNFPPKNLIRSFGAYLAGAILFLFGWAGYLIPVFILFFGVMLFRQELPDLRLPKILGFLVLLLSISSLVSISGVNNEAIRFSHGGFLGFSLSRFIVNYFGTLGAYIIFITLSLLALALTTEVLISAFLKKAVNKSRSLADGFFSLKTKIKIKPITLKPLRPVNKPKISANEINIKEDASKLSLVSKPKIQIKEKPETAQIKTRPQELKIGDYVLPGLDLLDVPPPVEARQIKEDLEANARILEDTLADFGITVKVTDIERGPVITRYELEPAPGVKLNRIVALNDDISLAMKAPSVRIVAPIPGKARVGVEVPNSQSNFVYLKEVFVSKEFQESDYKIPLVLGKDISGHPVITDLGDMPHLLIAGTTGSGKTVCVNCLILSMLFKSSPNEVKFVMVDPKMVELAPFNGLPHLLCPVVTDAKKAAVALQWIVSEMEDRYQLLAGIGARNIESYNEKSEQKMPYIVVLIDELADLMIVSRDLIENAITRLAQLSRAVGIHLVLATQRPSVDVITGVIKANFPARISFKVASKVDSRTVLDMNGADKLLGKGDMLFLQPGEEKLIRAQGSLITDKEIERVVDFVRQQAQPIYNEEILKEQQKSHFGNGEKDELYDEAVRIVMEANQASASILQRRLRLGYTRAARIIDTMEVDGMVGPFEGSKPRRILIDREAWLKKDLLEKEDK
ncbi:MAG: DNA translocase FtsK [Candidatus Omnitrophica bacterium]|nr:DNA translocase FtsK [Candidatus Omnitrophota bacterium]